MIDGPGCIKRYYYVVNDINFECSIKIILSCAPSDSICDPSERIVSNFLYLGLYVNIVVYRIVHDYISIYVKIQAISININL